MTYSIIQKSQLEGAHRLDAEYYQPEYLILNSKFKTQKSKLLKEFAEKIFSGPFGSTLKSESYQKEGIPFIRIGDISDVFIDRKNLVYISKSENKRIFGTHLNPGDIIFSKIGTIGRLSVISDDLGQVNISENNIGIRLSKLSQQEKISLLFFLLSKHGQLQILRSGSGNIQQKLNVADIENVMVPIFSKQFQWELLELYEKITEFRNQNELFYSQAENLFLEELGLRDCKEKDELFSVVNFSEAKKKNRIDAEYFQQKYEKLLKRIKEKNGKLLGEIVSMKKGIEPGAESYLEEGKKFIRVSNMSKFGISDNDSKYVSEDLYKKLKDDFEPKIGEILLTKDATPGIACVLKEDIEGIMAGGILRLRIKDKNIEDEYLALCLNSIVGQMQAERDAGGSVIAHWKPEQIKNVLIPILPKPVRQKITGLIQKSYEARKKAKELLEEAKHKVEEMIEK